MVTITLRYYVRILVENAAGTFSGRKSCIMPSRESCGGVAPRISLAPFEQHLSRY